MAPNYIAALITLILAVLLIVFWILKEYYRYRQTINNEKKEEITKAKRRIKELVYKIYNDSYNDYELDLFFSYQEQYPELFNQ